MFACSRTVRPGAWTRRTLRLLTVWCVVYPGALWAQAGHLSIFADPAATECSLPDDSVGVTQYFVVHVLSPGVVASTFSAPLPPCHTGQWLSDTAVFPATVGDSQSGVTVGYGGCVHSPIHVLTINVMTLGTTSCCCYPVLAHPAAASGKAETTDCGGSTLLMQTGLGNAVNPGLACVTCPCDVTVPVEASTWGRIKSIYR